jgi:hypothetical protein
MTYRSDLDALAARHAVLDAELAAKTRELESAARALDEARARASLPVLDNIRIATPCRADWNAMVGDERARHCNQCDKQVFDLSSLTRAEAEALIVEKAGELCARFYQRHDGTILLADCTVGVAAARKRKLVAAGAAALLATGVGFGLTHRGSAEQVDDIDIAPPAEHATGHVRGTVGREAPPPAPAPIAPDEVELRLVQPKMGGIKFVSPPEPPHEVYK